jgi:general stress protein 26
METTDVRKKLIDTLRQYDTLMVTTTATNGSMHARPMAIAEIDETGEVWFVTGDDTPKIDEVMKDARAVVTGQEKGRYLSLTGRIDVIKDREKVHALWKESWKAWFPDGKDDPTIVLMRLRPEIGEYWDNRGTKGVRFLFEAARALLNGQPADERIDKDPKQHAKVPL